MASLLSGLFGQQNQPQFNNLTAAEALNQGISKIPSIASANNQYNNLMAGGTANAYKTAENIYDPNKGAIRNTAGATLRGELDNPYAMPPQLNALLRQSGLQGAAGSGLNASDAGRAGMFGLLGTAAENRAQGIINQGLSYGNNPSVPFVNQTAGFTPVDYSNALASQSANQNTENKYNAELQAQNARNLFATPLNLAGAGLGTAFGAMNNFDMFGSSNPYTAFQINPSLR